MKNPIDIASETHWNKAGYQRVGMWENWCVLKDIANALRYGFSQYRLPKPGQEIDVESAKNRVEKIEEEWNKEAVGRAEYPGQQAPKFSGLSVETKCYLHSVLDGRGVELEPDIDWEYAYRAEH